MASGASIGADRLLEAAVREAFRVEGSLVAFGLTSGVAGEAELGFRLGRSLRCGALAWPPSFDAPRQAFMDDSGRLFLVRQIPGAAGNGAALGTRERALVLAYLYGASRPPGLEPCEAWLGALACLYGLVVLDDVDARLLLIAEEPGGRSGRGDLDCPGFSPGESGIIGDGFLSSRLVLLRSARGRKGVLRGAGRGP